MKHASPSPLKRKAREREAPPQMVPAPVPGETDLVAVDTTWGQIQPMEPAPGVLAIGEKELLELVASGAPLVDGRTRDFYEEATLPGARSIPFHDAVARREELEGIEQVVLFCNGPQCPQSPTAIRELVEAGFPAGRIRYYRGGMHDWVTLGLPTEPGREPA